MTIHRPVTTVLIANRGEIAARLVSEAKMAKLKSVAVYSDADSSTTQVLDADIAVRIGPAAPSASYLNVAAILDAAKKTNADSVHPGYGFLSENPDFAQSVIDAGLVWIGPSPSAIRAMGDKGNAKEIARKAGVPVIPGYDGDDQSEARLLAEAKKIGWPVLIKAALGGGGRGQRRVTEEGAFADALASAKREALSAFASDRMILEKALDHVRHVEVQVFGDAHGNVIHLGERDCSVQRRNQKIIEEAPAPGVGEELRARMGDAAVRLAKAVNYTNAGTVEFLLDREGKFYFLEMNTRIQVEHPVTEEVTGLNLIRMQFDVAMGKPLDLAQADVKIKGHAIEARLCAEDPADNFKPQLGFGLLQTEPGVRVDIGEEMHFHVSADYDSMIAKIIARGPNRTAAIKALREGIAGAALRGLRTNRNFLIDILDDPDFKEPNLDIAWLTRRAPYQERLIDGLHGKVAALLLTYRNGNDAWRSTGPARSIVKLRERDAEKTFVVEGSTMDDIAYESRLGDRDWIWGEFTQGVTKRHCAGYVGYVGYGSGAKIHVTIDGDHRDAVFEDVTYAPAEPKGAAGANVVRAPMAGRIVKVLAEPGATVEKNQILVILEAMKMEHELRAGVKGKVETLSVKPGDQVAIRQTLVTLSPA